MGGFFIKGKKRTPEPVIQKLAEGDRLLNAGSSVAEIAITLSNPSARAITRMARTVGAA
jgi:hypothetical protein